MDIQLGKEYYYVCPYVFLIEKIKLEKEGHEECGKKYYIENSGAYLADDTVFETLEEAKGDAFKRLNEFYSKKLTEIMASNPIFIEEE